MQYGDDVAEVWRCKVKMGVIGWGMINLRVVMMTLAAALAVSEWASSAEVQPGAGGLKRVCEECARTLDARVGIAVLMNGDAAPAATVGALDLYPMMSVVKLPLAVVVMQGVADGRWRLDQRFALDARDLKENTWSPLREAFPQGGEFTLCVLLDYMVAQSDNNVCDYLFELVGGPPVVEAEMRRWLDGEVMQIRYDEEELRDVEKLSGNRASPLALCRLLQALHDAAACASCEVEPGVSGKSRHILPPALAEVLLEVMAGTRTGASCLAAGVPEGCRLEHKTGSGPMLPSGRISARNDVGIIRLPGGGYACVAVFVANAAADAGAMDAVMSRVAAAVVQALRAESSAP